MEDDPPRSPNFGELWKASVKAMKHHLKRSVGETLFNYEELNTLVVQILNSLPFTLCLSIQTTYHN